MCYNLNHIRRLDSKLLALGKNTPETRKRQGAQNNERGRFDFAAAIGLKFHPQKKNP